MAARRMVGCVVDSGKWFIEIISQFRALLWILFHRHHGSAMYLILWFTIDVLVI